MQESFSNAPYDSLLQQITDYVIEPPTPSALALQTARSCLLDSLGCGLAALAFPACRRHLGPWIPGAVADRGVPIPGTKFRLDPIQAAFDLGCTIRWLDYNDTWLAAEWGHPSDNLGALLACAHFASHRSDENGPGHPASTQTVGDLLRAMIQAHEIQGVLALENAFNRVGLDHVILVKVASTALATRLLGGNRDQILSAVSHAWIDGQSLRTYRHAPNVGPRKSWAAGDATSRAVRLAFLAFGGEPGVPSALTAPKWGFQDVMLSGRDLRVSQPFGSYVMENVLFKIAFPAEFHAQTAAEAALRLHPLVAPRLDDILRIEIQTQESAVRIIDKTGLLKNPADRDHCLQYIVAVPLLFGQLTAEHYEDSVGQDPRLDRLRSMMTVTEDRRYTQDYLDPAKRSIANAVQVFFRDGSATPKIEIEFPLGHRFRRSEGDPLLLEKFRRNAATVWPSKRVETMLALFAEPSRLDAMSITEFLELWAD